MNWDAKRIQASLSGVQPVRPDPKVDKPRPGTVEQGQGDFRKLVTKAGKPKQAAAPANVNMSAHASQRLIQRGVILDQQDMAKISDAMDKAAEKGAKESLFLLRDIALVVSVDNRTVITALQGESARQNVFTQIDSAVLID